MAKFADGTPAEVGMKVRVIEKHFGFDQCKVGETFVIGKIFGKFVASTSRIGGNSIPASKCVKA